MRFIVPALMLLSAPAFACPNLAGKYKICKSATGQMGDSKDIVITQAVNRGITTYTLTSTDIQTGERSTESIKADGKTYAQSHTDQDTGMTMTQKQSASCAGQVLSLNVNISFQNQPFADMKLKIQKSGNKIIQKVTGQNMGQQVEDTVTCE